MRSFIIICLASGLLLASCEKDSSSPDTEGYLSGKITSDGLGIDGVIIEISTFHITGTDGSAKNSSIAYGLDAGDYSIGLTAGSYRADYIYPGDGSERIQTARYPIEIVAGGTTVIDVEMKDPIPHSVMVLDGNAAIEISWESSYGATGYNLYRAFSDGVEFQRIAEIDSASGTINYSDLPENTGLYHYYVTSTNSEHQESGHEGIKQVTFTASIRPPSGLEAIDMVDYVALSWNANIRAEYYKIYRSQNDDDHWQPVDSTVGTSFTDTPQDFDTYFYNVTAMSAYGTESAPSLPVSVLYDGRFDPPQELAIVDQGSSLYLSWLNYETAAYFSVYRSSGQDDDFVRIDTTSNAYYSDAPVDTGTYYYYVTATAQNGLESEPSNTVSSYFDGLLDYPQGFTAVDRGLFVELSWQEVPWAGHYILFRSSDGTIYVQIATIAGAIRSYNDTPNFAGTYYYCIATETMTGVMGELSEPAEVEFTDNLLPPTGIEAENFGTYIVVSWTPATGASGCKIYRARSEGGSYEYIDSTLDSDYTDAPQEEGSYYYKLRSFDELGHVSDFSPAAYVYFDDIPMPPYNITAVDSVYRVELWWQSHETAADYMIYRSLSMDGIYLPIRVVEGLSASDWPSASGQYFYKLRTIVDADTSELSEFVYVLFSGILQSPQDLMAYDAGTHIHLSWTTPAGGSYYEVYRGESIDGQYARISTVYNNSADDAPADEGVYFYKVKAFTQGDLESEFSTAVQVEFTP